MFGLLLQEWCEKQMEFVLNLGRVKPTKAMKAGAARHAALEEEVSVALAVWTLELMCMMCQAAMAFDLCYFFRLLSDL